jgi:hypothetical protein
MSYRERAQHLVSVAEQSSFGGYQLSLSPPRNLILPLAANHSQNCSKSVLFVTENAVSTRYPERMFHLHMNVLLLADGLKLAGVFLMTFSAWSTSISVGRNRPRHS